MTLPAFFASATWSFSVVNVVEALIVSCRICASAMH